MSEFSSAVFRAAALTLFSALFAGMWHGDRPQHPRLARHLPADQRTFVLRQNSPHIRTPAKPVMSPQRTVNHRLPSSARFVSNASGQRVMEFSRSIRIESRELRITSAALQAQISQIRWGTPAGSYRIVDSQGGVGWLHIVDAQPSTNSTITDDILTIGTGDNRLRLIRVQPDAISTAGDVQGIAR